MVCVCVCVCVCTYVFVCPLRKVLWGGVRKEKNNSLQVPCPPRISPDGSENHLNWYVLDKKNDAVSMVIFVTDFFPFEWRYRITLTFDNPQVVNKVKSLFLQ